MMDEQQIQDIADRVIDALYNLAPGSPDPLGYVAALTPLAALLAAVIGYWNLRQAQKALAATVKNNEENLKQQQTSMNATEESNARSLEQKREADARAEWWRRTQWSLEAMTSGVAVKEEYGAAVMAIQAESNLAGPEELAMLESVLKDFSNEKQEGYIDRLLQDAQALQVELTPEEENSLYSNYGFDVDEPPLPGDNGDTKEDADG